MPGIQIQKLNTLTGHRDCVYALQPSGVSSVFFSGAGDGMVVKWDMTHPEEGERIAQLPNSIYSLHYLSNRDILIAGHNYEGIHLLDWRTRKEIASLKLGTSAIFDIQTFGDDCFIASGDGSVTVVGIEHLNVKKPLPFRKRMRGPLPSIHGWVKWRLATVITSSGFSGWMTSHSSRSGWVTRAPFSRLPTHRILRFC